MVSHAQEDRMLGISKAFYVYLVQIETIGTIQNEITFQDFLLTVCLHYPLTLFVRLGWQLKPRDFFQQNIIQFQHHK